MMSQLYYKADFYLEGKMLKEKKSPDKNGFCPICNKKPSPYKSNQIYPFRSLNPDDFCRCLFHKKEREKE